MHIEGSEKNNQNGSEFNGEDYDIPAAITDTGCERQLNEDRYAVIESQSGLAWLVCDGMGGVTGGELAAQLAIDAIRRDLENLPGRSPEVALKSAVVEANRIIVLRRQNQAFASMGTTLVGIIFSGAEVVIASVGDSRAYLVRDGAIQQLTVDHTFVQELVDKGQIKPEEALSHPQAHILTRCIGAEPGINVETRKLWIWQVPAGEPKDFIFLCSDGLYSHVSDGEIASMVAGNSPQKACVKLVELAKSRGGFDNITLAVIPLDGQLKSEPPIGYQPVRHNPNVKAKKQFEKKPEKVKRPFGKTLLMIILLSMLCVLLTVVGMVVYYLG
jgi:serine/threonine protein phosphatase PrpC